MATLKLVEPQRKPSTPLFLPEVTGLTLLNAALAYAAAGWFVFPIRPGTKEPAIGDWTRKSSRDPVQIKRWWKHWSSAGIALHVGRSGAVAFDLDELSLAVIVDAGRPDIAEALANAGGINGTRKPEVSDERGHYLFACEVGEFSNAAGEFGRWGEVRGNNGYIVVAPSEHVDADSKDGEYRQIRTGELTPVPEVLRAVLAAPGASAEPLSHADFEEWLDDDHSDSERHCGAQDCKHSPKGQVAKFNARVADGASRYETMVKDVGPWGFREAVAGCYRKRAVFDALVEAYEAVKPGHRNELYRALRWAAAQAQADPQADRVHPESSDSDGVRLWRATELRPAAAPNWLAKGRLPRGAISLLVGDEGIGKSLLWVWITAAVTTGKPLPEFGIPARAPADVIVAVTEDDWSTTVRPRLDVAGADLSRVRVICEADDGSGAPEFPRHLPVIAAADPAPALIVVDAWLDTVPAGLSVRDPQQARQALHPWKELATVTDAAVLLLTHTNRVASASARDKYGATGELRKKARMTLYAQADDDGLLSVGPEKSNTAAPLPASQFRIDPVPVFAATEDSDGTVPRLVFVGDSERTARELVADALVPIVKADDTAEIDAWLTAFLAGGPVKASEVYSAADAAGFSKDQAKRAKKRLDIGADRPVIPGPWFWSLPAQGAGAPVSGAPLLPCDENGQESVSELHSSKGAPKGAQESAALPWCTPSDLQGSAREQGSAPEQTAPAPAAAHDASTEGGVTDGQ